MKTILEVNRLTSDTIKITINLEGLIDYNYLSDCHIVDYYFLDKERSFKIPFLSQCQDGSLPDKIVEIIAPDIINEICTNNYLNKETKLALYDWHFIFEPRHNLRGFKLDLNFIISLELKSEMSLPPLHSNCKSNIIPIIDWKGIIKAMIMGKPIKLP